MCKRINRVEEERLKINNKIINKLLTNISE